jgi:tripartite-type tricarboxylate transporter receptor subunit TctC
MRHIKRRAASAALAAISLLAFLPGKAMADWPDRPIKLMVGYAAGGGTDIVARIIAPKLSEILKVPVVIENRAGAAGMIAEGVLAKAAPDGYMLLLDPIGISMSPSVYRKVPYDPIKDIQPVAQVFSQQFVIVVTPELPVHDLKELVALMRNKPNEINIAVAGTSTQLAAELFLLKLNLQATLVPYKGSAPASTSIIAGETQVMFADVPSVKPFLASGRIRALNVMGYNPSSSLPNIRPASETGVFDGNVSSWAGVFAPAGTPTAVVSALNAAVNRVARMPEIAERLAEVGVEPVSTSVEEFTAFYHSELVRWKDVVVQAKIPAID